MMSADVTPVERVECLTREEFERSFVERDKPVIIAGALSGWRALDSWSPRYIADRVGACSVSFKRSSSHVHPGFTEEECRQDGPLGIVDLARRLKRALGARKGGDKRRQPLSSYLDLIAPESREANRYYLSGDEVKLYGLGKWNPELEPLWNDARLPDQFQPSRLRTIGLWLSAKGVRSHLHYDGNALHNLNAQITGKKRVTLFPPSQASKLYPFHASRLELFNFSRVNIERPNVALFPRFEQAERHEGELSAGDLLFIPACWFHSFEHRGDFNANINFWWQPDSLRASATVVRTLALRAVGKCLFQKKITPFQLSRLFYEVEEALLDGGEDP
jgi:lysine-specific demethylase 8